MAASSSDNQMERHFGAPEVTIIINIKTQIKDEGSKVTPLKCNVNERLKPLFKKYCEENGWEYKNVTFLYIRGEPINPKKTPTELGITSGAYIEAIYDPNFIYLLFKEQNGTESWYQGHRFEIIEKTLIKYCERKNFDYKATVFLYKGERRIKAEKTPNQLGLKTNDEIDVFMYQTGG